MLMEDPMSLVQPSTRSVSAETSTFRPPAVPLVTHTPYFSIWSMTDQLTDGTTKHWTGKNQSLAGLVRIDGETYRFMGPEPVRVPAMEQVDVKVLPTRTIYRFAAQGITLELEFMSPLLADDLDLLSQPVTYVTLTARSTDGKAHDVQAYLDVTGEVAVNTADQAVLASRHRLGSMEALSLRSQAQPVLEKRGDDLRIDWGAFYLGVPYCRGAETCIGSASHTRTQFVRRGDLPDEDDLRFPRPASDAWPVVAAVVPFGRVGADSVSRKLLLAYDEEYTVEYFHRKLPPYWRRDGKNAGGMLRDAEEAYSAIRERCRQFDAELMAELEERGGHAYAQVAALSYRQCLAAHCLAEDLDGTLLMFSKENFSNGCLGTVDVTYPGAPFFLYFNATLLRAQIEPVLHYASMARWKFPFAPHDLGTYPKANGQVYGGGEETEDDQMPVEECGNMLLLAAALGDAALNEKYWPLLTRWADYLVAKGMDPENQLCTDDFAGHLAHNANLSLKAILAIAAYAKLGGGAKYRQSAEQMAQQWLVMADDGANTRLAFNQPGSWSQKYNLVWDQLLELNLFPRELARREISSYLRRQNRYGLPLDNRADYTKLDWIVWTATLAESRAEFDQLIQPLFHFANESESRVPLTDWFNTVTGEKSGFQARSVVGGVFIPLLKPTK